jgi:DNA-binding NtrC family response regulator
VIGARTGTCLVFDDATPAVSAPLVALRGHSLAHALIVGGTAADRRSAALAIHAESAVRRGVFVDLDCAMDASRLAGALDAWLTDSCDSSDPSLMAAARGTLYLDHLEALSGRDQRRLLAFVTHRTGPAVPMAERWSGRLICGSGADLDGLAQAGRLLVPLLDCLDKVRISLERVPKRGAA